MQISICKCSERRGRGSPIHLWAHQRSFRQACWHMWMHVSTPANTRAIGQNELRGGAEGRAKRVWEGGGGRGRRPSVYSASIPRAFYSAHHAEETKFGLQTFITVCPGRGTEARRHTSTHTGTHKLSIMNSTTVFGGREGLSVSVCTGRGHSRGHGRCQGGRGWIIAAPPLSSLFVASLRRERPSLPIRRLGFCLRFMSVACLLHQA